MRTQFLLLVFCGILLTPAGNSPASSSPAPIFFQETMDFSLEGKITEHSGYKLTVNTQGNIVFRVVYSESTAVGRADGSAGTSKDLTVGTRIFVEGDLTESGEIIARKISLRPNTPAKKS